jgi:hypothetical protein
MELLRGIVHGRMIELENEPGLPDGQSVTVVLQPSQVKEGASENSRESGLQKAFGSWAEDAAELDDYLEWNRRQRKQGRKEMEP